MRARAWGFTSEIKTIDEPTGCGLPTQLGLSCPLAIAEGPSAGAPEEQHAAAAARKDDIANHSRAVKEDTATWIPGIAPIPYGRVTLQIIDQGCIRHMSFDTQVRWIKDKGCRAVGGAADDGETAVPGQCRATERTLPLRWNLRHVARDKSGPKTAHLIEAARGARGQAGGGSHPMRYHLAPRGII